MRLFQAFTLSVLLLAGLSPVAGAASEGALGLWNRDDGLGGIRIAHCGGALCGHVTWLKDPAGPGHVGERVLYDMHPTGNGTWSVQAFNPADGKNYAGTLTLAGNRLVTKGCVLGGLICKSLGMSRAR